MRLLARCVTTWPNRSIMGLELSQFINRASCGISRSVFCALGQQSTPLLPDPKLIPGDVFDVTIQDICTPGYSKKVRAVTAKLKRQAHAEYGITSWEPGDYEVDHLIPLSLGGSNSIRNLCRSPTEHRPGTRM